VTGKTQSERIGRKAAGAWAKIGGRKALSEKARRLHLAIVSSTQKLVVKVGPVNHKMGLGPHSNSRRGGRETGGTEGNLTASARDQKALSSKVDSSLHLRKELFVNVTAREVRRKVRKSILSCRKKNARILLTENQTKDQRAKKRRNDEKRIG